MGIILNDDECDVCQFRDKLWEIKKILGFKEESTAEEFYNALNDHLTKKQGEIPENHIKKLCQYLGEVEVFRDEETGSSAKLSEIINPSIFEEEMKKIVMGARCDILYEMREFAQGYFNPKEDL